jgi:hypothetical protein
MTSKLRSMIAGVGVFVLGGVAFYVSTPQPATRTMAELRDAGILDGQKFVMTCPERLTSRTKNRIKRLQPDALRPKQSYGHVSRVAVCFNPDGGNCFRPSDGLLRVADLEGEVVIPSLRRDLVGTDEDAGVDGDGEDNTVDDSLQYRQDGCEVLTCQQSEVAQDAGTFTNPYQTPFCGALNRLALQVAPCMIPNCWGLPDGGWDDNAGEVGHIPAPDCKGVGPYGEMDGGARWRGCNVAPREWSVGSACLPVSCSVVAGDAPQDWL